MSKNKPKIIFVYNADSGVGNALLDYGKKYIQPSKYNCQLCMITYGPLGMKRDWKKFINNLSIETEFLHKDELNKKYPKIEISHPSVLIVSDSKVDVIVSSSDFEEIDSLEGLKKAVRSVLVS